MRRLFFVLIFIATALGFTSCGSSTWSYISNTNNAVWLKVEGNKKDMSYRMWLTTPAYGEWGNAAAWGHYTAHEDNDVSTGHPATVIHFFSTSGESGNIHALDSLKQNTKLLEILSAVNNTVRGAVTKALTSDMIELHIDKVDGRAQFRTSLIPLNMGLDAFPVRGGWR